MSGGGDKPCIRLLTNWGYLKHNGLVVDIARIRPQVLALLSTSCQALLVDKLNISETM